MKILPDIAFIFLFALQPVVAGESAVSLNIQEQWSNLFGGKESVFHIAVTAREAFDGRAGWRLSSSGRTLGRGEREISAGPAEVGTIELRLQVPEVKEGVIIQALLSVSVYEVGAANAEASIEKQIWIFPEDPFVGRKEWLKKLNIRLFDPEENTIEVFTNAKIPFEKAGNIDSFAEIRDGILLIGEGVSLKDYRGLSEMMVKTAASGTPVLCLAPADGEIVLPGMGDVELPAPNAMIFRRNDIITELDKRLDADAWPQDGKVVAVSLKLKGERGPVIGEIKKGGEGWTWVEMNFGDNGGNLIVCGFGIIEKWNSGPTPRFLLAKIFEYIITTKSPVGVK